MEIFQRDFSILYHSGSNADDKDSFDMQRQIQYLETNYQAKIELLQAPLLEISSTTIRNRAAQNRSIRYMVPDSVADYIQNCNYIPKEKRRVMTTELTAIRKKLEKKLKEERYIHTLGVMYTAASMAMRHGADVQKA